LRVDRFDFELPAELIAQAPAEPRDAARLLVVQRADLDDRLVRDLPQLLRPGDLLVLAHLDQLQPRLAGQQLRVVLHVVGVRRTQAADGHDDEPHDLGC